MFYERFVDLCLKRGISPSAAAEAIGQSRRAVTGWKSGAAPRFSTIKKLADFFGVPVEYFDREDDSRSLRAEYGISDGMGIDEIMEIFHKNPKLQILFSRSANMSDRDIDFMLQLAERMNSENEDGV